jgi:hypothetical protein
MRNEKFILCERIKQLGFAQNKKVRLYGEVLEVMADPVVDEGDFIFVDAREQKSGRTKRIRLPLSIVKMAKQERSAA